ncbi:hypothetical protein J437_LFUL015921 [Ladona fulva]|uniref:Cytohesin Ubiquitin Protein Inducing domain-containing protein n=1 Tax=Ladona fulva TaxID=123851 RepID=A0A8K0KHS7_LADFU|nr:hypothetical protein J437_LFUL015921 [Ladona fulva]
METDLSEAASHDKNNVALLEARKKDLEAALQAKTEELRRLCVAEAELTGELPPETPLGPGEEPPVFRRRVHTAFTLPNNLIDKIHSTQEESLLGLELEYEIQSRITSAALHLANDCSAKKAVRRQRRLIHQQSQRRLLELEARLNMVQQNMSHKSQKPRKKPRPPLDIGFSKDNSPDIDGDPIFQDDGVSLSPLGVQLESQNSPSIHSNSSDSHWQQHSQEVGHCKPDSRNQPLLLLLHSPPHQQRRGPPHYAQMSHNMGYYYVDNYPRGPPSQQYSDPSFNERVGYGLVRTPLWSSAENDNDCVSACMMKGVSKYNNNSQNFHSLDKIRAESGPNCRPTSLGSRSFRRHRDRFGSLDRQKHAAYNSTCMESRSVDDLDALQVGLEGTPSQAPNTVSSSEESSEMHAALKAGGCNEERVDLEQGGFSSKESMPEESHEMNKNSAVYNMHLPSKTHLAGKGASVPMEALLPGQTYPEHSLGHLASVSNDRVLLRTQSLGSVESSNVNARGGVDVPDMRQVSQLNFQDPSLRKLKEKEWYETSLDTPASQLSHQVSNRGSWKPMSNVKPEAMGNPKVHAELSRTLSNNNSVDVPDGKCINNNSKSDLSSEAYFQQLKSGSEVEGFDTVVPIELPKNHMVIEEGKMQPYWEETKPFEMSDFYKYSTKFRKSHAINPNNDAKTSKSPQSVKGNSPVPGSSQPSVCMTNSSHQTGVVWEQPKLAQECGSVMQPSVKSPQQKGVYMPLQPLTCHPLEPIQQIPAAMNVRRGISVSPVNSNQQWTHSLASSPLPIDIHTKGGGLLAKDGVLSAEMIAWHQDQNVSHSATLV